MSNKRMTAAERRRRQYIVFSIVMVGVLSLSALAPIFTSGITAPTPATPTTPTPAPVIPTPIADLASITFENQVVSSTGLFSVAVPTGWEVGTNTSTPTEAQLTQRNTPAESVIETRVILPPTPVSDVEGVRAFFDDTWLASSWRDYTSWDKASDAVDGDRYIADFNLRRTNRNFIARQEAWTDGTWIYMVRVVTPPNAPEQLKYVLDGVRRSLVANTQFEGAPFNWSSYFDTTNKYLIRYPSSWAVTDSASGAPTSLAGDGASLRIETMDAGVADVAAAEAWVAQTYGATIISAQAIDRFGTPGFAVAYETQDADGGAISGYVVMLVEGDRVHVADLRMPGAGIDLNAEDDAQQYSTWKQIMDSFGLFPEINSVI
jgi:hypothetical protein